MKLNYAILALRKNRKVATILPNWYKKSRKVAGMNYLVVVPPEKYLKDENLMNKQIQSFDYYSKFIGETSVKFSAVTSENKTHIFSLWTGYSDFLFQKLLKNRDLELPIFLKNWNAKIGWTWDDIPDKISETEIDWLIFNLKTLVSELEQNPEEIGYFDLKCLFDFIFFLESVNKPKFKLEISDDY